MHKHSLGLVVVAAMASGVTAARATQEPSNAPPVPRLPNGIPDRVSLEEDSPFYFPAWQKIGVRFNGGDRRSVVEFCVSEGWLRTQIFHGGRPKKVDGKSVTNTLHGVIEPYWR